MTTAEFQKQVNRLISVYGDKAYPQERLSLIWRELKRLDAFEFDEIVSELIASSQQAPMIGKFREACFDIGQKRAPEIKARRDAWLMSKPNCSLCRKTGTVLAVDRSTGFLYAFKCQCEIGDRVCPRDPPWNDSLRSEYKPEFGYRGESEPIRAVPSPLSLLPEMLI